MQTGDAVTGNGSVIGEKGEECFFRGREGEIADPDTMRGAFGRL